MERERMSGWWRPLAALVLLLLAGCAPQPQEPVAEEPPRPVGEQPQEPVAAQALLVSAVIDGDTIDIATPGGVERVRLLGINAPERSECFGQESTATLAALLATGEVVLEGIVARRGTAPAYIRCDNGPELTANALRDWCRFSGTGSSYIEPGAPWENPYVESFNGRLRDEFLAVEQFDSPLEAQVLLEDWRIEYNTKRPHSSLGWLAPAAYAEQWRAEQLVGLS